MGVSTGAAPPQHTPPWHAGCPLLTHDQGDLTGFPPHAAGHHGAHGVIHQGNDVHVAELARGKERASSAPPRGQPPARPPRPHGPPTFCLLMADCSNCTTSFPSTSLQLKPLDQERSSACGEHVAELLASATGPAPLPADDALGRRRLQPWGRVVPLTLSSRVCLQLKGKTKPKGRRCWELLMPARKWRTHCAMKSKSCKGAAGVTRCSPLPSTQAAGGSPEPQRQPGALLSLCGAGQPSTRHPLPWPARTASPLPCMMSLGKSKIFCIMWGLWFPSPRKVTHKVRTWLWHSSTTSKSPFSTAEQRQCQAETCPVADPPDLLLTLSQGHSLTHGGAPESRRPPQGPRELAPGLCPCTGDGQRQRKGSLWTP